METRRKFVAVLTAFLIAIAARTVAKPIQTDLSSLSSIELQYYFGRSVGVPEYRLLNTHHLRRDRRSATEESDTLRYNLDAFDETFQLTLQQTKNLFNAGTLVHRIGAEGVPRISSPEQHCYYSGKSENHANSKVFLSTCNGLFGTIIIDSGEYVIQPLKSEHIDESNDASPNHVIYKKPTIASSASCANADDVRPSEEDTVSERRKRDLTDATKYIEASVVVDDEMHKTYGNETESYVLGILNQVSGLFQDSSLDSNVVLHINKITIIEKPQKNLGLTNDLDYSLDNFCKWQKGESSDISLLVTRRDLQSVGNKEVTGKAADVGGACNPDKRCLIAEDHGPSGLVFTVAHEIGHSVGMYHDGGFSDCKNKKNIMASLNSGGSEAFRWSGCSNEDFNNFLRSEDSGCLDNEPLGFPEYIGASQPMAGYNINATRQCQLTYGPFATAAVNYVDTEMMCEALRCDLGDWAVGITNAVPPLDGTSCGTSKRDVCIHGSCMKVYSTLDCDGGPCVPRWLEGAWGGCGSDCIETRAVFCVEIHTDDGTTRLVDESTCPVIKPATQRECCTTERYQYQAGPWGTCSVTCDTGVELRTVVCMDTQQSVTVDASLCTALPPAESQPCVRQSCSLVTSFNYVIGAFGECAGTCGQGVQSRTVTCIDGNGVLVAPTNCVNAGLGTVATTQVCDTGVDCNAVDVYRYVSGDLGDCSVTCGTGVQTRIVLCVNQLNIAVADSFCVSQGLVREDTVPCQLEACLVTSQFRYVTGTFGECSVTCGTGVQERPVTCLNENNLVVSEDNCIGSGLPRPSPTQPCQAPESCPVVSYTFVTGNFGPCDVTCGAGVRSRSVFCVNQNSLSFDFQFCLDAGLEEPAATTPCTVPTACPGVITYMYDVGNLQECTVTCGEGVQLRDVTCIDNNGNIVDELFCTTAGIQRPADFLPCFAGDCTVYLYFVGEWNPCSVTCGGGVQIRNVECRNNETGEVVDNVNCPGDAPTPARQCAPNDCDVTYEYLEGPFGTCNCEGQQSRIILCVRRSGTSVEQVDVANCAAAGLTAPDGTQACTPPISCDGPTWATTEFGGCSATCGTGVESRLVFCVEAPNSQTIVDSALCNPALEPNADQECDSGEECPNQYIWLFSDFGSCSVTCGEGTEIRSVRCYSLADGLVTEVDVSLCPADGEPPSVRPCVRGPCNGVWQAADWGTCSASCGCGGTRTRAVECYTFKGSGVLANSTECIAADEPSAEEDCFVAECPSPFGCEQTYTVDMGTSYQLQSPNYPNSYPNDLTCMSDFVAMVVVPQQEEVVPGEAIGLVVGDGYHIEITFTDFNLEDGLTSNCEFDYLEILDVQGTNSVRLCGTITDLPYVYSSTGPELQITFVTDASNNGRGYSATYAVVANEGASYVISDYGPCSVTCGDGTEVRTVVCSLNDEEVDETECASLERPVSERPCNVAICPTADACLAEVLRTDAGTLSSPNFPSNYTNDAICVNRIVAPLGQVIAITNLFFELEDSVDCSADALVFNDVNSLAEPSRACGSIPTAEVLYTSTSNEMLVTFVTDEGGVNSGFSISYDFVYPTVDLCNQILQTNNQPIYSPGFPGNYSDNEDCQTTIINVEGCILLNFQSVDLASDDCNDTITIIDQNSNIVNMDVCRATELPLVWRSASGLVRVNFISDADLVSSGYLATVQFDECYVGTWIVGDWQPCTVTCGEGLEVRSVECYHSFIGTPVPNELCPPEVPAQERPCTGQEECPSCDREIMVSGTVVTYPMEGSTYGNNEDCVTTITNPSGCMSLIFLDFDIQPGSAPQLCDRDYLEISDGAVSIRVCGNVLPPNFQSVTNTMTLRFVSDDLVTAPGYSVFPSFNPCPAFAYIPGNYSECDTTCGLGMRVRDVPCVNLATNTEVADTSCAGLAKPGTTEFCEIVACPSCDVYYDTTNQLVLSQDYPSNYSTNLDCVSTFNNTNTVGEMCILLRFLQVNLDPNVDDGEGPLCDDDGDYLEAVDLNYPTLTRRFCGSPPMSIDWVSRSSEVSLRFRTDDVSGGGQGFQVYESFTQCSPFGYVTGEYQGCDVTCGGGRNNRTVTCVTLANGNVVTEALCQDARPSESIPCGEEECPSCDAVVGNMEIFNSPSYPMSYENDQECEYSIYNPDGCISLLFLGINLEQSMGECKDFVEISDDSTDLLTNTYCGDVVPSGVWRSRSSNVTVRFSTDEQNVFEGFSLYPTFTSCPAFGYVTQEFGECSVTCGDGRRLRQVNCINLATEATVVDSMCIEQKPPTEEPCSLDPCPSCNRIVNATGTIVNNPDPNLGFESCTYFLSSPDPSECVRIFFINFALPDADDEGVCTDYIQIEDDIPGYTRDQTFCGSRPPFLYEVISSEANVTFQTSNENGTLFQMYVSFQTCPEYGFAASEFGECSVTCGEGTQTRTVICYDTANMLEVDAANCAGDEMPLTERECSGPPCPICYFDIDVSNELITSPGFPNDYLTDQDCIYNITNSADNGCIRLAFLYFELADRVMGACSDFLTVDDTNDNDPEPQQFCNREAPMSWDSSSGNVVLNFVSDGVANMFLGGFSIVPSFQQCPDPPPFIYEVGEYGECDVTCGEGIQTRTVICVGRADGNEYPLALCEDTLPQSMRPCSEEPCPSCDQTFTSSGSLLQSPNFPDSYENNQECVYNVTNVDGDCINILFISFNLEEPTNGSLCNTDYLTIEDAEVASTSRTHCGFQDSIPEWKSRTSTALVTFSSNDDIVAQGFNLYATFVPCPQFGFVATEWTTCDAGCGGGVQSRTVECQRLATGDIVAEDVCSDVMPPTTQACNTNPCPSCDEAIVLDKQTLTSPMSPAPYGENYNCEYTYTAPTCMILFFVSIDLPPPNEDGICDQDYLLVEDLSEYPVSFTYCGDTLPPQFHTRGNQARVTFRSDNNGTVPYDGFSIYNSFNVCPSFGFVTGEFSMCDQICGGGMQSRTVDCVNFATQDVLPENICTDQKPVETQACNTQPCPSCDETITQTQAIFSPNYPAAYYPSRTCTYTIVNPMDCVRLTFLVFNVPQGNSMEMCTTDFVQITDLGVNYLNQTLCGTPAGSDLYIWESQTGNVEVTLQSGPVVPENSNFQIYVNFGDCPTIGWVAGDFGSCSQTCGLGVRERIVQCQNLMTGILVDASNCNAGAMPPTTDFCMDTSCPSCDEEITTSDVFKSLDPYGPNRRCVYTVTNPDPTGCINLITLRLDIDEPNNGTCNVSSLTFEDNAIPALTTTVCGNPDTPPAGWMSASNSISVVFETSSEANQTGDMGWEIFPNFVTCPNVGYSSGPYGMCSASCEGGMQVREVLCRNLGTGMIIDIAYCTGLMPETTRPCNTGACPQECGLVYTPTSNPNPSQTSTVMSPGFGYGYPNDEMCTNTLLNPEGGCIVLTFLSLSIQSGTSTGTCDTDYVEIQDANFPAYNTRYCGPDIPSSITWRSAGSVVRVVFVSDSSVTDEGFQLFYNFANVCPASTYETGSFGSCSVTCGGGTQVRPVTCRNGAGQVVSNTMCPGAMPNIEQVCNENSCATFVAGEFDNCTAPCGGGTQNRTVTCEIEGVVVEDSMCTGIKPVEFQNCNVASCPVVVVGNYSECDTTCGPGLETRSVDCTIDNVVVDPSLCADIGDYNTTRDCNLLVCPDWVVGNYSQCPATCGIDSNFETRNVTCENADTVFADGACINAKPDEMQLCNNRSCEVICGDTITPVDAETGIFSIPWEGGNYADNLNCSITFDVPANFIININFASVDVNFAANLVDCTSFDYIEIVGTTQTLICNDGQAIGQTSTPTGAQSTYVFSFYSNGDGQTGNGVTVSWNAVDTTG